MRQHGKWFVLFLITIYTLSSCKSHKQVKLVLLPDIQTYSRLYPNILRSQIQWVVDNADSINFVLQQGDMTDHNIDKEWKEAAGALNMMDNKLPYAFVMGNHDLGKNSNKRDSELLIIISLTISTARLRTLEEHLRKGKWIMYGILSKRVD